MSEQNLTHELQQALNELREGVHNKIGLSLAEQKERDEKINLRIDELAAKINKPILPKLGEDGAETEYTKAFRKFIREGDESVVKVMSVGTNADGGFTVPVELDRMIDKIAIDQSPLRQIANVIKISTESYQKLVSINGATSGWGAETTARANTNTPQFAQVTPNVGELWATAHVTSKLLEDSFVNIEQHLADEIGQAFATAEGAAFVSGNGVNRPKGFLAGNVVTSADSARTFGDIQYIATGVDADWAAASKPDKLIDLVAAIKAGYRQGAVWLMAKSLVADVRKFKDTTNSYLWQPSLQAGMPSTLLGFPVYEDENMPAKASNSYSVAFGNFKRAFTIVDRTGMSMLRDPYTAKPYVVFYARRRVGSMLVDSNAVKVLKFYTS